MALNTAVTIRIPTVAQPAAADDFDVFPVWADPRDLPGNTARDRRHRDHGPAAAFAHDPRDGPFPG